MANEDVQSVSSEIEESSLEALKNSKTGKYFVLVDDQASMGRVRVINPHGDVIVVGDELFDVDPILVQKDSFAQFFSQQQLQSYKRYAEKRSAEMKRELETKPLEASRETASRQSVDVVQRSVRSPRSRSSSNSTSQQQTRGRIVSQWTSHRLTFYRHKIEPLKPRDQFKISVEGHGDFVMTKQEFQDAFNNVVMSEQYRHQGMFAYSVIPEAAARFRTPS